MLQRQHSQNFSEFLYAFDYECLFKMLKFFIINYANFHNSFTLALLLMVSNYKPFITNNANLHTSFTICTVVS